MVPQKPHRRCRFQWKRPALVLLAVLISLFLVFITASAVALAGRPQEGDRLGIDERSVQREVVPAIKESPVSINARQPATPVLTLNIISSPEAVLDHNDPGGDSKPAPQVFVVEAVITNTGTTTATNLVVGLDYNEDPVNGWVLLSGEHPTRTLSRLGLGEAYHAYWLARYSTIISRSHQYTVTAFADNADLVATSENYYNPSAGYTVRTAAFRSNAVSSVSQMTVDTVVGVIFTVTIDYDLGNGPHKAIFSPAGNPDFDPGALRLVASKVRLYNDAGDQESTVYDRLYFPTLPPYADNAEAIYTFIALTPSQLRLCSYAGVGLSNDNYDQFFCSATKGTIVPITSTLSMSLSKQVSSAFVQQNDILTYTIRYTNTSGVPLSHIWVWDEIDRDVGSVISSSITPPAHPAATTDSRVAWYLGDVSAEEAGTLSFEVLVDGNGVDLIDGTPIVNFAFYGVNVDSLPVDSALTSTITSTVLAPTISVAKTDGQATVETGDALTYSLRITNSGSAAATGLLITDVLPAYVNYVSQSATPGETNSVGQTLVWDNLGPIPPAGGTVVITVPVTVASVVPNGTSLTNTLLAKYENAPGHVYATATDTDTTTVYAPDLTVVKSDAPDPVLSGHLITYTLYYTNSGAAGATNVVITDTVPLSTTYQTCAGGTACELSNGVVSWTIGAVPEATGAAVSFSVLVSETLATGTLIRNDVYAIVADQTPIIAGPPITTSVSRDAAYIDGFAYIDANGDGVKDNGEVTLSGIAVALTGTTVVSDTTTDGGGYYRFRIDSQESISVTSAMPTGNFRTTPGTVYVESRYGTTQTVSFGFAPTDAGFGVIFGTVFEDVDTDGTQTAGESGLPGVTVTSGAAVTPSVTTNSLGQYTLSFTETGTVTITETDPPFFVSTTPNQVITDVVVNASGPSPIDFGDFAGLLVTGRVFEDLNVNGVNDDGAYLAGAIVTANGNSFATGDTGVYTLYVPAGENPIQIVETDPPGYVSTNAVPGVGMSRLDANTLSISAPVAGAIYSDGDFGDVLATNVVTISGQVWDDDGSGGGGLANGLPDGLEPGLPGAVIRLSSGLTQTTSTDGLFTLYALPGAIITVTESNPLGYVSTNAIPGSGVSKLDNDTLRVGALSSGETVTDNLFGDVLVSSVAVITGTVFDDANLNGVLDSGETGLGGITVTLEIFDGPTIAVLTDQAGNYQFALAPGTDARITSAGPGGSYYPTTPESVIVRPASGGVYPDNNFGYSDELGIGVIHGVVFDDADGDGSQDFGELGLAGAVITMTGAAPITTTGNGLITGTFAFTVTTAGVHDVHETNPPGYRSTTPDDVNVSVTLRESHYVEFGDSDNADTASVYGTVFDDLDGDGMRDPNEPGLAGVVVSVTIGSGVLTDTTAAYGQYSFSLQSGEAGLHTINEQDPALTGYRSTTPDQLNLNVTMGNEYVVDFGDTAVINTFSNIMGTVFNDVSGDGTQEPGEPGLGNVLISLSDGQTTRTDFTGRYSFAVSETGTVQVFETDPGGFYSTTPNTVTVDVEAGQHYTVDFGDSNNPLGASIFGTVFDDQNVNGVWDLTELGLSGITVTLGGSPDASITNELGQFTFRVGSTGTYTIAEIDAPGYVSTNAIPGDPTGAKVDNNTLRVQVDLGSDAGNNLFGDVLAGTVITISGTVWDDNGDGVGGVLGDGIWNGSEPGLAGATVGLSSGMTQTTAADGAFLLYAPPGTVITVTESNPLGYISTNAVPGSGVSKLDNDTLRVGALSAGETVTDNLFGDVLVSSVAVITGTVFDDANVNATLDAGELGLGGITVTLSGLPAPSITNELGQFTFLVGSAGTYTITEIDAPGYVSTNAIPGDPTGAKVDNNTLRVQVDLGSDAGNNLFGDVLASAVITISGTVWDDNGDGVGGIAGDGIWNGSEPGLAGATVGLSSGMAQATGADGAFLLYAPPNQIFTVTESNPFGYFSTNAIPGNDAVKLDDDTLVVNDTLLAGEASANNLFGDTLTPICTCPPDSYEENDVAADAKPLGIGEAFRQSHDFCDDAVDWMTFTVQADNVYTITTSSWGQQADTFLSLYDTDGQTLLATNDDYEGAPDGSSRIVWQAPSSGVYYLRVNNRDDLSGCETDYDVWIAVREETKIYLPIIVRSFSAALE